MKKLLSGSFRSRLFVAFLAVSLVPLLICSAMLLQAFRLRLMGEAERDAAEYLNGVSQTMDTVWEGVSHATAQLRDDALVLRALAGEGGEDTDVYGKLFDATSDLRAYARFDLYDSQGNWRYSTLTAPLEERLPTNWGVLYAAAREDEGLTFIACQDVTDTGSPLLQGAAALTDGGGRQVGYLLVSMYQSNFRQLLDGKYGLQNDLILLDRYWRPVYCAQPSLAASLAPVLRQRLMDGQPLNGGSEEFLYWAEEYAPMGLYLVLQRPQVFTRDTMQLLYTVSLTCALVCVVVSVLVSLKVSRQMFRPIARLQQGIRQVEHNDLDVYVPPYHDDELGQLAQRFNGMVAALKRNQEELVENQRELNEAQIRMLQAQLNPHFLCNTLDTMKWISKINKVPQVALMSTNLADILRFCISPDEFVPLRKEAEILERYIEIQRIRLSDAFTFQVEVPMELEECLVPKMILQPLVENAILHGVDGMANGCIRVECAQEGGLLRIVVTDNGRGFPPEMVGPYAKLDRTGTRGHLGLYNVDTILVKYYGEEFGLYLDSPPDGKGAAVTAVLPIQTEEGSAC